ncbi:MAG: TonB-dependent receptor plug domain-containing protein [Proteobacteria bacterium]|nr:TonB-dependent receptor plug domain-containing protein [Pseudomonadota bacterium]
MYSGIVNRSSFLAGLTAVLVTAFSGAQAADQTMEEVIVTSERRVESLQDVAASVQVFTDTDLLSKGVNYDFRNLQNLVPALTITNQEGKLEIFLRGIGSADSDFSSDPSIATYYNDVYLPRPRSIGPMFFDVDRVEVYKGPQGTIRGRNATGGSINVIPKVPSFDQFEGYVLLGMGNFDQRSLEAVINLPTSDTFALRLAANTEAHDSYYTNAYGNTYEAPGALNNLSVRLSALWEPSEKFSLYFMTDGVSERGSGYPGAFSGRLFSNGYDIDELDDPFTQYFRSEGVQDNTIFGAILKLKWTFSSGNLEFNTSWRKYDFYTRNASRIWQLGFDYPGVRDEASLAIYNDQLYRANPPYEAYPEQFNRYDTFHQAEYSRTRTNEIRVSFDIGEKSTLAFGVFGYSEKYDGLGYDLNIWPVNGDTPDTYNIWANGCCAGEGRGDDQKVNSTGIYFNSESTLGRKDIWRLIAGIRITEDRKEAAGTNAQYQFVVPRAVLDAYTNNSVDTSTNPFNTGLSIGSNGFRLTEPGERTVPFPGANLCEASGTDEQCASGGEIGRQNLDYFLDGVASFGVGDNFDDFILANRDSINLVLRSNLPNGSYRSVATHSYGDLRFGFEVDVNENLMLYYTLSTGTRAGGINQPFVQTIETEVDGETVSVSTPVTVTWDPERLSVSEFGLKYEGELNRINMSLFSYAYTDKVIQTLRTINQPRILCPSIAETDPCTTTQVLSGNVGDASIIGIEVEALHLLGSGFKIEWNTTFLNAVFDKANVTDPRAGNATVNINGNRLPNTPKANINFSLSQDVFFPEEFYFNSMDWTINFSYRSKFYLDIFNNEGYNSEGERVPLASLNPGDNGTLTATGQESNGNFFNSLQPDYTIINLNLGFNMGEADRLRADMYISNVTNTAFSGKAFINDSVNIRYLNIPRTYGLRIRVNF